MVAERWAEEMKVMEIVEQVEMKEENVGVVKME